MNAIPVLGLALILGAPMPKEAKKPDPPSIVGEWTCVEMTHDGDTWRPEPGSMGRVFNADGEVIFLSFMGKIRSLLTYSTDPKKEPARLDMVPRAGEGDPKLGIYKIEKDTLTLCYPSPPGVPGKARAAGVQERPTKFEAPAGSGLMLMTLKRVEKKKE
jgi:uncharacterized protein (TIGR03067 family)